MERLLQTRSIRIGGRWFAAAILVLLAPILAGAIPSWWVSRGVLPAGGMLSGASDFSALNLGQLKTLAFAAYEEMAAPGSVGVSLEMEMLIKSWVQTDAAGNILRVNGRPIPLPPTANTADFAAVNVGQLKTVARPFYQRLIAIGYTDAFPWDHPAEAVEDFAMANVGQAKTLFRFDVRPDTDGDGMPDWWELRQGLNPNSNDGGATTMFWGMTNAEAFAQGFFRTDRGATRRAPSGSGASLPAPPPSASDMARVVLTAHRTKTLSYSGSLQHQFSTIRHFAGTLYFRDRSVIPIGSDPPWIAPGRNINSDSDVRSMTFDPDDPRDYGYDLLPDDGVDRDGNGDPDDFPENIPATVAEETEEGEPGAYPVAQYYEEENREVEPIETAHSLIRYWNSDRHYPGVRIAEDAYPGSYGAAYAAPILQSYPYGGTFYEGTSLGWLADGFDGVLPKVATAQYTYGADSFVWTEPGDPPTDHTLTNSVETVALDWVEVRLQTNIAPRPGEAESRTFLVFDEIWSTFPEFILQRTFTGRIVLYIDGNHLKANRFEASPTSLASIVSEQDGAKVIRLEPITPATSGTKARRRLLPVEVMVDADRDGELTVGRETTSEAKPFRFWLNDDDDEPDGSENAPISRADNADALCDGKRDLEDFTRLHLYFGGLQDAIRNGDIQVGMEWKNVTGTPAVWLYRSYDRDGSDSYLKEVTAANNQIGGIHGISFGKVAAGQPLTIDKSIFQYLTQTAPKTCLIFEGAGEGKGQLVLTFWKGGQKIGDGPGVWLDLKNVRKMYERAKAEPPNIPHPHDSATTPPRPTTSFVLDPFNQQWDYSPTSWTETKEYVVFVHGWNTTYHRARGFFADTFFKRLWQKGYRGRMAALYWPTLVGPTTYNESEYRAWIAGESLKQYVESLPADYIKHLAAHSMGNIVSGSALRHGLSITNYALLNAAVPASCYDNSSTLHQPFGVHSPDHDADAPTQALVYKNKLATVGGNLISFYLESDDALEAWTLNNALYKPEAFYQHAYAYIAENPSGQKLLLNFEEEYFGIALRRILVQLEESLAYAAKSSTRAVGAEPNAHGSVSVSVNQAGYGYEDEHSAFWAFDLQSMKLPYERLMDELGLERNP